MKPVELREILFSASGRPARSFGGTRLALNFIATANSNGEADAAEVWSDFYPQPLAALHGISIVDTAGETCIMMFYLVYSVEVETDGALAAPCPTCRSCSFHDCFSPFPLHNRVCRSTSRAGSRTHPTTYGDGILIYIQLHRKPIYDDFQPPRLPYRASPSPRPSESATPTPTDRLAIHIGRARLYIYAHILAAENRLNEFMSTVLHYEDSFTQTIASLAPPPESHEQLAPGSLYVLVAAMSGSIITRNRKILLRATVPAIMGLGVAWLVLPVTTRNVADLVWKYEEKVPVIAFNHIRIRAAVEEGWRQAKIRSEATRQWSDNVARDGRELVEGWMRSGK